MARDLGKVLDVVCFWALIFAIGAFLASCGSKGEPDETEAPKEEVVEGQTLEARLLKDHVQGPFVISREKDGSPVHMGEGILWGGVASYVLPCELNDAMDQALVDLVVRHKGALVRYEPLGEYAGGREITWDGAVGFYLAVADSIVRCGRADRWREPYRTHLAYLDAHHQAYHENTDAAAAPGYDTVHDLISHRLGLRGSVSKDALTALDTAIVGTLASLAARPAEPCFLANLAYLSRLTARTLGHEMAALAREAACFSSKDLDLPTWDHVCGRRNIDEWAHNDWRANEWEFRHQRCGNRESADGHLESGRQSPALDRLLAKAVAHGRG